MNWRIISTPHAGGSSSIHTPAAAIDALTDFSLDANGDPLEASFTAHPNVDIHARDIITLQTHHATGWEDRWFGIITQAGSARSPDLQEYRAVGQKHRLYEVILTAPVITGGDVAAMVREALQSVTLPKFVQYHADEIPDTGFTLGTRYPQLESLGDFLDALAQTVGHFIVPTGEAYEYDGRVYRAGDIVPAVTWGVGTDRCVFFRRPWRATVGVSERARRTRVTWAGVSAESVITSPVLVFAAGMVATGWKVYYEHAGGAGNATAEHREPMPVRPLYAVPLGTGDTEAHALREVDGPLDFMRSVPLTLVSSAGFTDVANAYDDDLETYAIASSTSAPNISVRTGDLGRPAAGILRVRYRSATPTPVVSGRDQLPSMNMWARPPTQPPFAYARAYYTMPEVDDVYDAYYPFLFTADASAADVAAATDMRIFVNMPRDNPTTTTEPRVYDISFFVVDDAHALRLAQAFVRDTPAEVAEVTHHGILPVTHSLDLTTSGGEVLAGLPVERTSYAITRDDGVTTTYHVGQAYSADLMAQRVVLERLARRATKGQS